MLYYVIRITLLNMQRSNAMARPGITYQEVLDAIHHLQGQNRSPTIETIRHYLGSGSSTTLAKHLQRWKQEQAEEGGFSEGHQLPRELVQLIQGLWQRMQEVTNEKITQLDAQHALAIDALQQEVTLQIQQYHHKSQQYDELNLAHQHLSTEQAALLNLKQQQQEAIIAHLAREENLQAQLHEREQRIIELHRLQKQSQENLEHYRETVREQRLQDQAREQERQQQLELALHALQRENQQLLAAKTQLEAQLVATTEALSALQEKNQQLNDANHQHSINQKAAKIEYDFLLQQKQTLFTELTEKLQSLQTLQTQSVRAESQINQLSNQLLIAEDSLTKLSIDKATLVQEKWELAQEKSQLLGQLKQLQTVLDKQFA